MVETTIRRSFRRPLFFLLLILIYTGVTLLALTLQVIFPLASSSLQAGQVAYQDILAPADITFTSEVRTQEQREAAVRAVCEPIFDRPLKEISFGHVLLRLFQTSRRFNVEIQPQLVLLQKTLLNIEGLGRQLDPDLDLWQTAKPFLERWMHEQVGVRGFINHMKREGPQWAALLPQLPRLAHQALTQATERSNSAEDELARLREEATTNRRLASAAFLLAAAALLLAALQFF